MYPQIFQKLIEKFSQFPTIGPRTATRFVFYLLKLPKNEINELINLILELRKKIKKCSLCFNFFEFEKEEKFCSICLDPHRDRSLLCITATEIDLEAIEKTKKYNGLYFVFGGVISSLKKNNLEKLRIKELEERIKNHPEIKEIILAFNPNPEGEATRLYLERFLKSFNVKITRLGIGLPIGGELEYADEETLSGAFENRK